MLSRLLREFLFFIIHWMVNKLVAIENAYYQFCVIKNTLFNSHNGIATKDEVLKIVRSMPRMHKSLKHLVMLADTDHHSVEDLASLVIWSLAAGIPYLTFYDITGELKWNEKKFFIAVEKKKKEGIPGCIKWSNKPDLNGYTNGNQSNTIIINIVAYSDGRPKIAQLIQNLAKNESLCKKYSKLTAQELDTALLNVYSSIPEPDLALYTGPRCCTNGLLPWHIRLTEIFKLSPDHSINVDSYIGALYRYNKCEQRFGT